MKKIIHYVEAPIYLNSDFSVIYYPTIFLAGPIQGTKNWQKQAIDYIFKNATTNLIIASPRTTETVVLSNAKFDYNEQVDWETYHLRQAGKNGVVLFWLANQDTHYCDRPHAQTTRFELGELKTRNQLLGEKLVVGFDSDFTNSKYIKRRLEQDCPTVPLVFGSLEETCKKALELL